MFLITTPSSHYDFVCMQENYAKTIFYIWPKGFWNPSNPFFCCKHISWNNFSPQSKFPTFIYWRLEFRFFLLLCRNRRNKSDSIFRWLFCDGLAELGLWWQTNVLHRRRQNDYSNFFVQMPSSFSHQKSTVHTCWWFCLNNGRHTCYWSVFTLEKLFLWRVYLINDV